MHRWIRWVGGAVLLSGIFYSSICSAQDAVWQGAGWYWIALSAPQVGSATEGGPFVTRDVCLANLSLIPGTKNDGCIYFATKEDFDK